MVVVDEGVDRQQLDRRDAERFQVADRGIGAEAGIGAAQVFRDVRMLLGKTLDMGFVDDGLVPMHVLPGGFGGPVEIRIDHDAFRHERRAVALVEGEVVAGFHFVAEHGRIPGQRAGMRARIGIEQQLVRIEAVAVGGIVRPVNAIAVEGAGADARNVAVKYLVGVFGKFDAGLALAVEQADLDLGGVGREQRKVGTLAAPVRAERIGKAFFDRTGHDAPFSCAAKRARHNLAGENVAPRIERFFKPVL